MKIGGFTSTTGSFEPLYQDDGSRSSCSANDHTGIGTSVHVCTDVMQILVTSLQQLLYAVIEVSAFAQTRWLRSDGKLKHQKRGGMVPHRKSMQMHI